MGYSPDHKRMRDKYSPIRTAAEWRHNAHVKEQPCYGCGHYPPNLAHHTLLEFEDKRWKRDHMWLLPLCWECHQGDNGVHGLGSEIMFLGLIAKTPEEAIEYMRSLQ